VRFRALVLAVAVLVVAGVAVAWAVNYFDGPGVHRCARAISSAGVDASFASLPACRGLTTGQQEQANRDATGG
jgi:hypothetical protein